MEDLRQFCRSSYTRFFEVLSQEGKLRLSGIRPLLRQLLINPYLSHFEDFPLSYPLKNPKTPIEKPMPL